MKLIEITKNGKKILTGTGEHGITNPIEITFTIDEAAYNKLENITQYYKMSIYDALSTFCEESEELVAEIEYKMQFGEIK